ncbi:MAG: CopG family transcriptional regulator [Elusimicrobia bacterium]|nr:CopG family transcriptional regulator [Elusimicrobiota bacterium]
MMKRSQIYLPAEQWHLLRALSLDFHQSVSELIRKALDRVYKKGRQPNFEEALNQMSGLWKNRRDLPSTQSYVRGLRRGTRLREFYKD